MKFITLPLILLCASFIVAQSTIPHPNQVLSAKKDRVATLFHKNNPSVNLNGNRVKRLDSTIHTYMGTDPYYDDGDSKMIYEYNEFDNTTDEKWYYKADSTLPWLLLGEGTRSYDNNNNLLEKTIFFDWDQNQTITGSRQLYAYNNKNQLIDEFDFDFWDGNPPIWYPLSRYTYSYYPNGLEKELVSYDHINGQLEISHKYVSS